MKQLKVLILTDHRGHSKENALYEMARKMSSHTMAARVDVATRAHPANADFFEQCKRTALQVSPVGEDFKFDEQGLCFSTDLKKTSIADYDAIWLRLPPPLSIEFLNFLKTCFPDTHFINDPSGIHQTGSKAFLVNFEDCCPPMRLCADVDDIVDFSSQFPIVLKPLREYGGRGIVRIDGDTAWLGNDEIPLADFLDSLEGQIEFLAVKYLEKVSEGDKRIIVIDGQIMGAALRLPKQGSWICNVAMGGRTNIAQIDEAERSIIQRINPKLAELGIIMYGVDTLMGDQGERVLSEINTTSIGGLPQIAKQNNLPLVEKAVDLILQYISNKIIQENDI